MCTAIRWTALLALIYCLVTCAAAQAPAPSNVPALTSYSGSLTGPEVKPLTGRVGVTLSLYNDQQGGAPLWLETQSVKADRTGRFTLTLGATTAAGLPPDLFVSGEARWLGVQAAGQPEQPRVLLLSVPYALKAGDAQTIGGLPPSAFMLAPQLTASSPTVSASNGPTPGTALPPASSSVTTTGGTVNAIPLFTTATNIQNSILTQTGATAVSVAGRLNLPAQGVATAAGGKVSRTESFVA